MQVGTEIYIKGIHQGIDWIIKQNKVKPVVELPKWQIDFEKYGGRVMYEIIKTLYWDTIDSLQSEKINAADYPMSYQEDNINKLLKEFRKDINVQLDIPKKYDIYR